MTQTMTIPEVLCDKLLELDPEGRSKVSFFGRELLWEQVSRLENIRISGGRSKQLLVGVEKLEEKLVLEENTLDLRDKVKKALLNRRVKLLRVCLEDSAYTDRPCLIQAGLHSLKFFKKKPRPRNGRVSRFCYFKNLDTGKKFVVPTDPKYYLILKEILGYS